MWFETLGKHRAWRSSACVEVREEYLTAANAQLV